MSYQADAEKGGVIRGASLDRTPTLILIASMLVLPLAVLLLAQWPLREWVQAGSRQANDVAQIVFALYVAVAITAASRANTHLAAARPTELDIRRARVAAIWRTGLVLAWLAAWRRPS